MTVDIAALPAWLASQFPNVTDWQRCGERRYRGRAESPLGRSALFLVTDETETRYHAQHVAEERLEDAAFDVEGHTFARLDARMAHDLLPTCVVADCGEKAPVVFTAAEYGRLAGRDWEPGNEIRLCPAHGHDVFQAQGVYGRDKLADWLQADAKPGPLDEYDAEMSYDGIEHRERTTRMLQVRGTS